MRLASSICLALSLPLWACAAPTSYMGVPFTSQVRPAPQPEEDLRQLVDALSAYRLACKNMEETSPTCRTARARVVAAVGDGPSRLDRLPLGELARLASMGSKRAQLELGVRFEEGRGVACDPEKARALYRKAATSTGGTIWVYQPPVGNGTSGRTVPIDSGPREVGLASAAERLAALERRMERALEEGDRCAIGGTVRTR